MKVLAGKWPLIIIIMAAAPNTECTERISDFDRMVGYQSSVIHQVQIRQLINKDTHTKQSQDEGMDTGNHSRIEKIERPQAGHII